MHENRIYSVKMHCGDQYPDKPPTIQFVSQVNLPCVNQKNGMVDPNQLPCLAHWKRENTMETILIELRRLVQRNFLRTASNQVRFQRISDYHLIIDIWHPARARSSLSRPRDQYTPAIRIVLCTIPTHGTPTFNINLIHLGFLLFSTLFTRGRGGRHEFLLPLRTRYDFVGTIGPDAGDIDSEELWELARFIA